MKQYLFMCMICSLFLGVEVNIVLKIVTQKDVDVLMISKQKQEKNNPVTAASKLPKI